MAEDAPGIVPARLKILREQLRARVPNGDGVGCFLCQRILQDLEDGKISGVLPDAHGNQIFPREGELAHLQLEGFMTAEEKL